MSAKTTIFINQSPNDMLYDIADQFGRSGENCILISGKELNRNSVFNKVILFNEYQRSSIFSRLISWIKFTRKTNLWLKENHEGYSNIFIVSNPPLNLYLPLFNKKIRNKNISYLAYDLYPDIVRKMMPVLFWLPSLLMSLLNKKSFQYVNHIYTPSEGLKAAVSKYTSKKINTIYNWTNIDEIHPVEKSENKFLAEHHLQDKFIVLYSGNLGKTHDINTILESAELTKDNNTIAYVFIGHGEGMKKVQEKINAGFQNLYLFPWQDEKMFRHSIACGDIAWVGYRKGYEEYSIPSKLPFFLVTGTPVIMIGEKDSELTSIILNNKIGFQIANDSGAELAGLLQQLQKHSDPHLKINCISTANKLFSKNNSKLFSDHVL